MGKILFSQPPTSRLLFHIYNALFKTVLEMLPEDVSDNLRPIEIQHSAQEVLEKFKSLLPALTRDM